MHQITQTFTNGTISVTPSAWKYCPYCGEEIEASWKFCGSCGKRLGEWRWPSTVSEYAQAWQNARAYKDMVDAISKQIIPDKPWHQPPYKMT